MSNKETGTVDMEINGQPYYVKSKEGVPYLYDIDTHDEVGYWSSKKGQYVMFSLYNRLMKEKYENQGEKRMNCSSSDSTSESEPMNSEEESQQDEEAEEESQQDEEEEESQEEEAEEESLVETKNQTNTYSLMILFLILFVYLTLQKEFQSIYFDFIFLILINLLNTLKVFEILNDE
jgi:cation transport ATPase